MPTGKESKPSGNIHRQQLFYWMGGSLDRRNAKRKVLSDALVTECLAQLRGSLSSGLWVKSPRYPEEFTLQGRRFALDAPICCFTEWSLGESLPHTAEYGRIGLGFPKRWVIERGGQSVTYFRHNEKGSFLQAAFKLLGVVGQECGDGVWSAKPGMAGFDELRYLLHFAKMIRVKRVASARRRGALPRVGKATVPAVRPKAAVEAQAYKRKFGLPLEFVEEREWRIVHSPSVTAFVKGPPSGAPDFYLPYLPGEELFTLVVPDNKVLCRVLEDRWFTERLFTPWKRYPQLRGRKVPPVTLLSHSDIGTF